MGSNGIRVHVGVRIARRPWRRGWPRLHGEGSLVAVEGFIGVHGLSLDNGNVEIEYNRKEKETGAESSSPSLRGLAG